ncbi:DNA excision repair protein ERCC-6-like, partial [Python bivittatus]|uniref:DNA excision repair protein ERCC-6-like n=1 Tax=Python bivittatus TaxID=176946 RepID=A0A9F5IPT2_PYTBI
YVSQAKQEARSGNLEESIQLFQQALEIHFSEKLTANIKKLEEALAALAVDQNDDSFVDVCQSGLMLYGEMHDKLFHHQREGVAFLYKLYQDRRKGGILADDMGLGKTIQIIAFLSGMFDAELIRSVLLIVPTSLLNNWMKEFAKWTPGLRVKVFHGTSKAEREKHLEQIQRRKGTLLTTYKILLNSWKQLSSFSGKEFVWDYVILDEAHKIKTSSAKTTKSVYAIPSRNRILLTGTPVQNNLKELWALFDFACQAYRIGQKENVIIYRLITCGTVEEKIYRRQVFKDSLIRQSTGDKKNPYRYFTMQEIRELFILEDTRSSATQLQLQSLHATQRKTDAQLDEHIAYIHSLEIFGISDHDLMYTHEIAHDEAENEEAHNYIECRVQKAQELVQLESQLNDQLMRNTRNMTEGAWLRDTESSTQPNKPLKSSPSDTLVPSISEETSPRVVESSTPSKKKSPNSSPGPGDGPPVVIGPVISNEVVDLVSDDDNDLVSDTANLSSKMTSLITEVEAIEQIVQNILNMDVLPSEEKEHHFPGFQGCDLKQGIGPVSPFQSHSVSNKENYSPESNAVFDLPAKDTDDEQMVFHITNTDVLHSKNKEYDPTTLQKDEQNESLNVVSSFPQAFSLSIEGNTNSESKMISCDPSPKARSELKEMAHDEAENEEAHSYIERRVQKAQELVQLESQLNDQLMGNIRNMTEGAWLRDTESSTQPNKPLESSPSDTLVPSISEETSPRVMESSTSSKKKSSNPSPRPVDAPPAVIHPVISNEVADLVSNNDSDLASDMANLSFKMTSLNIEDEAFQQMLQTIWNVDVLPSEEKEHHFPGFQGCDLKQGIGPVSPFQSHSVSNKENYSPESNAVFDLPAKDTDDEQMVFHITNTDVLHSKNKEYDPTTLQKDEQNESLNVVSSFPQAFSLSIEGNTNSESKMISCDPSPKARSELTDIQMKLLQQSVVYPSDNDMHQTETEMFLDALPSFHGDACKINELDAIAPHETMAKKISESSALQKSGLRETVQGKESPATFSYPVNFSLALEDSEVGPQTTSGKDMSLEETENERFQLRLDSHCSCAAESVWGEYGGNRSLQTSKGVKGSVVMDNSNSRCDALMDSRESFGWEKKTPIRLIVLDDEEEEDKLIDDLDGSYFKDVSALNKPDGICMSTPKANGPMAEICFSPRVKVNGRRSTASQQSLFYMVLEELEAAAEVGSASNVSYDKSERVERELTQNYTD